MSKANLSGVPLLASASVSWSLTTGVAPFVTTIHADISEASRLESMLGQEVTLDLDGVQIDKLTLIQRVSSPAPWVASFQIADRRWLWQREWILRRFNVPRRTGSRAVLDGAPVIELLQGGDTFTYAEWSLNGGVKWTPVSALLSVLRRLVGDSVSVLGGTDRDVPIENLEVDDPGDAALARVLSHVPGAEIYVALDGTVVVFDRTKGEDAADAVRRLGPPVVGGGVVAGVDLKAIRPKEIHVLFTREVELRFDAKEEGEDVTETVVFQDATLELLNVLPVPDLTLEIDGRTVFRGTWARVSKVLPAWNQDRLDGLGGGQEVSLENLRRYWLHGLWSTWVNLGAKDPDANWVARLSTLKAHYRRTYQLAHAWMRRIRSIHPWRVGIVDPVTGARAPALVQADYAMQPSEKAVFNASREKRGFFSWMNVRGYPPDGLMASGKPAPCTVQILDDHTGVIHFEFRPDPIGFVSAFHPSVLENANGQRGTPQGDFRDFAMREFAAVVDGTVEGFDSGLLQLSPDHRILCVITATPGAPNNERQLHKIVVKPEDLGKALPESAAGGTGPVVTLRVPPTVYAARFVWMDSISRDLYTRLFGFNASDPEQAGADSAEMEQGELWQNPDDCRKLAHATALSHWVKLRDHAEGEQVGEQDDSQVPTGNLAVVTHSVEPNGARLTRVVLPPDVKPIDVFAFLDDRTRQTILGLVDHK